MRGNVSGVKDIGGFCYELYAGTMTGCYNTGSVTAAGTYVGGIMGYAKNATIQNVYNRGAVSTTKNMVGGLVGVMDASTVTNAYTAGTVAVEETGGTAVGAAIGWAGKVSNVYYLEGTAEKGIGRADDTSAATAEAKQRIRCRLFREYWANISRRTPTPSTAAIRCCNGSRATSWRRL